MENLIFAIKVTVPLFILISTGFFCKKIGFIQDKFLIKLNKFVFKFCFPIMLFQEIRYTYQSTFYSLKLLYIILIGIGVIIFFSSIFVYFFINKRRQKGVIIQGLYRSNAIIYGVPLLTQMYGHCVIRKISIHMCVITIFFNLVAVIVLSIYSDSKQDKFTIKYLIRSICTNPLIIGCVTGLCGSFIHLRLSQLIECPLVCLGKISPYLALFVMGGDLKLQSLQDNIYKVITATILKLIIIPIIVLLIGIYLNLSKTDLAILFIFFSTPTAIASYIMAKNMNNDYDLAGQIVLVTTIFSSFTIFLFVYFLRTFDYF